MNQLLQAYGVRVTSENAFLSFLSRSHQEVSGFSGSYLTRKVGGLLLTLSDEGSASSLSQVVPSLASASKWNGRVCAPAVQCGLGERLTIQPTAGAKDTDTVLPFLCCQKGVALNATHGSEVSFKVSGVERGVLREGENLLLPEAESVVSGRILRKIEVSGVRERSFFVAPHTELEVETEFGRIRLLAKFGLFDRFSEGDTIRCKALLTAVFERGDFFSRCNLTAQVYAEVQGALTENKPERFTQFLTENCRFRIVPNFLLKGRSSRIFSQVGGRCTYTRITLLSREAFIRDRSSVLLWKTDFGEFVLAFDLCDDGISGVYVDAAQHYSLREETLFSRWVRRDN